MTAEQARRDPRAGDGNQDDNPHGAAHGAIIAEVVGFRHMARATWCKPAVVLLALTAVVAGVAAVTGCRTPEAGGLDEVRASEELLLALTPGLSRLSRAVPACVPPPGQR